MPHSQGILRDKNFQELQRSTERRDWSSNQHRQHSADVYPSTSPSFIFILLFYTHKLADQLIPVLSPHFPSYFLFFHIFSLSQRMQTGLVCGLSVSHSLWRLGTFICYLITVQPEGIAGEIEEQIGRILGVNDLSGDSVVGDERGKVVFSLGYMNKLQETLLFCEIIENIIYVQCIWI